MKIFVLEDDSACDGMLDWLKNGNNVIKVARNIEDAAYYLEYEEEYRTYDKFILDASLPAATVIHTDGSESIYNEALNGIDFFLEMFPKIDIDRKKVVILTAFANSAQIYISSKALNCPIQIIDKNENDLTANLLNFLGMDKGD